MAKTSRKKMAPWLLSSFDMEGIAGGALALLAAILLGALWAPLFWLGFAAAIVILLATRDSERTPPEAGDAILAPCDGIVTEIEAVEPPRELRLDASSVTRVRISSSPFSVNGLRAPVTGTVESFLVEPGSPSAIATDPDNPDLDEAFATINTANGLVGLRVATGGLGPRINLDLEAQDGVRAGRKIGVRRLGGWCDLFLPHTVQPTCYPGMTVVGGETPLSSATVETTHEVEEAAIAPAPVAAKPIEKSPPKPEPKPAETSRKVPTPDDFDGDVDVEPSKPVEKVSTRSSAASAVKSTGSSTAKAAAKPKPVKATRPKASPPKSQTPDDDSSS